MSKRACKSCDYFHRWPALPDQVEHRGDCMRFPPDTNGEFSFTNIENWCGEYRKQQTKAKKQKN